MSQKRIRVALLRVLPNSPTKALSKLGDLQGLSRVQSYHTKDCLASDFQECPRLPRRVFYNNIVIIQECLTRASGKNVSPKYLTQIHTRYTRVSPGRSVLQEFFMFFHMQGTPHECLTPVSQKSVLRDCRTRVFKIFLQDYLARVTCDCFV